jgi:hypothetical protein
MINENLTSRVCIGEFIVIININENLINLKIH